MRGRGGEPVVATRRIVKAAFKEFRKTGKVIKALPEDEQTVRRLHAEEVLNTTLETLDAHQAASGRHQARHRHVSAADGAPDIDPRSLAPVKRKATTPMRPRSQDARPATLEDVDRTGARAEASRGNRSPCPGWRNSISIRRRRWPTRPRSRNRTAEKLAAVGIRNVGDLLAQAARTMSPSGSSWDTSSPIRFASGRFRRGSPAESPICASLDVKILVACGICEPEDLAHCEALDLLDRVDLFISTSEGQRAIRGGSQPDLDVVTNWIESARHARDAEGGLIAATSASGESQAKSMPVTKIGIHADNSGYTSSASADRPTPRTVRSSVPSTPEAIAMLAISPRLSLRRTSGMEKGRQNIRQRPHEPRVQCWDRRTVACPKAGLCSRQISSDGREQLVALEAVIQQVEGRARSQ